MTPDVREKLETAAGWVLVAGIFVFKAVETILLGPYRVLRSYARLGEWRSTGGEDDGDGGDEDGDGGSVGE